MFVRECNIDDAENLVQLIGKVESSSEFMMFGAGERSVTPEGQRKMISHFQSSPNSTILLAENNNNLAGYLVVIGGDVKRKQHSALVVIGINEKFRGQGVGTLLFEEMERWAKDVPLNRLELTVVCENLSAVHLYKKMGFQVEGTKRNSLCIDGKYFDEFYMGKII
ncbi:GNAT family N-acetyltransferase [Mangrovibacillus cuniculi]|uniref:GNAT family N-acetyltransferase n=2 Tax=Mangrovibacillus cuniculi TaxID=2593652 RepID=A0A7S8CE53_9BACI|nr:GNAT family N-acetyltransferase [Mangrovibacillus cuniculi]QPC48330.1 GNAT family N-acetyltransferase [Mangrovibacillus cuniculi]